MKEAVVTILMLAALFGYAAWERRQWKLELKARAIRKMIKVLHRRSRQPLTDLANELRRWGRSGLSASDAVDAMRYAWQAATRVDMKIITEPKPGTIIRNPTA